MLSGKVVIYGRLFGPEASIHAEAVQLGRRVTAVSVNFSVSGSRVNCLLTGVTRRGLVLTAGVSASWRSSVVSRLVLVCLKGSPRS